MGVASQARVNPGHVQEILDVLLPIDVRIVGKQRRQEKPAAMLLVGKEHLRSNVAQVASASSMLKRFIKRSG
jgi:hypothetical protein